MPKHAILTFAAVAPFVVGACGDATGTGVPTVVEVMPAFVDLEVGEAVQLRAEVYDDGGALLRNASVEWDVGTEDLAVDEAGFVRAVGAREPPARTAVTATIAGSTGSTNIRTYHPFELLASSDAIERGRDASGNWSCAFDLSLAGTGGPLYAEARWLPSEAIWQFTSGWIDRGRVPTETLVDWFGRNHVGSGETVQERLTFWGTERFSLYLVIHYETFGSDARTLVHPVECG